MFSSSVIVFAFLGLSLGAEEVLLRSERSVPYYGSGHTTTYHGPPAPLNHDGTVALTPEVHHAAAAHHAAYAAQYQRLHEADSLAAAHPDLTSPHNNGYNQEVYASGYTGHGTSFGAGHSYNQGLSYSSGHYSQGPSSYSSGHYDQGSSYRYNPEAHIPAPLNPDGTVAHTAAYKAIASNLDAEYAKAIHRLKYDNPHFQQRAAHSYHY